MHPCVRAGVLRLPDGYAGGLDSNSDSNPDEKWRTVADRKAPSVLHLDTLLDASGGRRTPDTGLQNPDRGFDSRRRLQPRGK